MPLAWQAKPASETPMYLSSRCFNRLRKLQQSGSRIANAKCDLQIRFRNLAMLGELKNIPTDTLIDMLYVILSGDVAITTSDASEIEQIQRELQRRGGAQSWSFGAVNSEKRAGFDDERSALGRQTRRD